VIFLDANILLRALVEPSGSDSRRLNEIASDLALTLAYAQAPGMRLATFDTDFDGLPGIDRWQPGEAD
jgi:predicted nucleic acid-binding protein